MTFLHSESGSISTDMCPTACGRAYTPNKVSNLSLREKPTQRTDTEKSGKLLLRLLTEEEEIGAGGDGFEEPVLADHGCWRLDDRSFGVSWWGYFAISNQLSMPFSPVERFLRPHTFEIKQRSERRHFTSLFRLEFSDPVPVRAVRAGARGGGDVDITDDKAVAEPFVQDPPDAFRHLVLVQFMVPRRDDVVRDVGEQVESGRGSVGKGQRGSRFGVDEAVAVDAVAGVDEEEVDAEGAGALLQAVRERVKVCSVALAEGGQGGAGVGTTRIGRDSRGWD
jgi:hypothetical protein